MFTKTTTLCVGSFSNPPKQNCVGGLIQDRGWQAGVGYRCSFNGKEKDDELKGSGNSLDFGARIDDSRLGRWLSVDPLESIYPSLSPYNFAGNNPILNKDFGGSRILIYYETGEYDEIGEPIMGSFEYGVDTEVPDNEFVQQTVKALDYAQTSRKGRKVVQTAIDADESVTIQEQSGVQEYIPNRGADEEGREIDPEYNMLNFDPTRGLELVTSREGREHEKGTRYTTGEIQSPAIGLVHELIHFNHDLNNKNKMGRKGHKKSKNYSNKEEKRTIRLERKIARQLGEPTRRNHFGEGISVKSVTYSDNTKKPLADRIRHWRNERKTKDDPKKKVYDGILR